MTTRWLKQLKRTGKKQINIDASKSFQRVLTLDKALRTTQETMTACDLSPREAAFLFVSDILIFLQHWRAVQYLRTLGSWREAVFFHILIFCQGRENEGLQLYEAAKSILIYWAERTYNDDK